MISKPGEHSGHDISHCTFVPQTYVITLAPFCKSSPIRHRLTRLELFDSFIRVSLIIASIFPIVSDGNNLKTIFDIARKLHMSPSS